MYSTQLDALLVCCKLIVRSGHTNKAGGERHLQRPFRSLDPTEFVATTTTVPHQWLRPSDLLLLQLPRTPAPHHGYQLKIGVTSFMASLFDACASWRQ